MDGEIINPGVSCKELGEERQPVHSHDTKITIFIPLHSFSGHREGNYTAGLGYLSKRRPREKIEFSSGLLSLNFLRFAGGREAHLISIHFM